MKAPLSWIREYVNFDLSPDELAKKLFSAGFEVEEIIRQGEDIDRVVTGKIVAMEKHPNADKLSICQVDVGDAYGGVIQIVTGAKNVNVGNVVPVALDNSKLPGGKEIHTGALRGVPSYGMMCSGGELNLTENDFPNAGVDGIMLLDESIPVGTDIRKVVGLDDVIFDIGVTANRSDCQSILGLAREFAAILGLEFQEPNLSFTEDKADRNPISVKVEDQKLCPRYLSRTVKNIQIAESPEWMKKRLRSMGLRPINNIVDITNYVLLEVGQPMHAFDINELKNNEIVVRRAKDGEKIVVLNESECKLNDSMLVITDGEIPVALAGIMGGLESGIKENTETVVFEAAKFARDNIRRTSKAIGVRSDSSARFEKGIDASTCEYAMNRALALIDELGCGKICGGIVDVHSGSLKPRTIQVSITKINDLLGIVVPTDVILDILTRLNFKCSIDGDLITCVVPLYRDDIENYQDIAEEVIRMYGYEHVVPTLMADAGITNGGRNPQQSTEERAKELLCDCGFNEIVTYSFTSPKYKAPMHIAEDLPHIKLFNPLGEDLSIMRRTLLHSILEISASNTKKHKEPFRFFEIANIYVPVSEDPGVLPIESKMISLAQYGEDEDFYTIKKTVELLLDFFGVSYVFERSTSPVFHPGRSADVFVEGEKIGTFGELHPSTSKFYGIQNRMYAGELNFDFLQRHLDHSVSFTMIPKFPAVSRDIAIMLEDRFEMGEIVKVIRACNTEILKDVKLFDLYQGSQIAAGYKSMAFSLIFQAADRTLKDVEVDEVFHEIVNALTKEFNAELRK